MKIAIIGLMLCVSLTSCNGEAYKKLKSQPQESAQRVLCPDVVEYSCEQQKALSDEIFGLKAAPEFIADYHVMRNQSRRCLDKPVPTADKCVK